jgi:hypothetical protein
MSICRKPKSNILVPIEDEIPEKTPPKKAMVVGSGKEARRFAVGKVAPTAVDIPRTP